MTDDAQVLEYVLKFVAGIVAALVATNGGLLYMLKKKTNGNGGKSGVQCTSHAERIAALESEAESFKDGLREVKETMRDGFKEVTGKTDRILLALGQPRRGVDDA